ncbi:hydroxymethylbilane synthase [Acidaminobacterium chupaoyuni]
MNLTIGSRESKLAVIQTQIVMDALGALHPDLKIELLTMKTTGDIILDRTLDKIGGKGLFVKELDRALEDGRADLTVHSFKDMPMEEREDLPIVAVSPREDPRDALVLPAGVSELDLSRPIGCASARRRLQLQKLFPGCLVKPVRGNVLTRLEKLDSGEYSALVLAGAGLKRLGLDHRISRFFPVEEMLPAACQGILAVQARKDFDRSLLKGFHDPDTWQIALAERAFVRALDGGCSSPVAAHATLENGTLTLRGLYVNEQEAYHIRSISGPADQAEALGASLALSMKKEDQDGKR